MGIADAARGLSSGFAVGTGKTVTTVSGFQINIDE
jgi:hypothetical protein